MNLKIFFNSLTIVLMFTTVDKVSAGRNANLTIPVQVNIENKKPKLQILDGEKKISSGEKILTAPLIITIDEEGNIGRILDPDTFSDKCIKELGQNIRLSDVSFHPVYPDYDEIECCSIGNGCGCIGNGILDFVKGLGKFTAGTIIVASVITFKAGKFLAIRTYKAANWVCRKIYNRTAHHYEEKTRIL